MYGKFFKLSPQQIQPLAIGLGSCFATDRIVVDGAPVGYMYRETPDDSVDSGWRFFAGDEDSDYMEDPRLQGIYDVNVIANYDQAVIALLAAAVGSVFKRGPDGVLRAHDGG